MKKTLDRKSFIKIYEELGSSILFSDFSISNGNIAQHNKMKRDGYDNIYLLIIASVFIIFHKKIYHHVIEGEVDFMSMLFMGLIFVCLNIWRKRFEDNKFLKKMPRYYLQYHLAKDEFKIIVQLFHDEKSFFVGDKVRIDKKIYTIEKISYLDRKVELSDKNRYFFEELTYIK